MVSLSKTPDLPVLESKFDQVLEQFVLLTRDIERGKWDAGVTIMVNNGKVDVRGLGTTSSPVDAAALLFMAIKTLPPFSQAEMLAALIPIMERSERIEIEAPFWRSTTP
jgi:hypothetical protein